MTDHSKTHSCVVWNDVRCSTSARHNLILNFDSTAAALPQLWPLGVVRLTHAEFYLAIRVRISPSSSLKGAAIKGGKFSAVKGDAPPVAKLTGALSRSSAGSRAAVVCGGNRGGGKGGGGVAARTRLAVREFGWRQGGIWAPPGQGSVAGAATLPAVRRALVDKHVG